MRPDSPLAERMRPQTLEDLAGQGHILGPGKPLRRAIEAGRLHSMVLWGPPGTGKTTLARLIASATGARLIPLSAVMAGVRDIRRALEEARAHPPAVLFIDEVHRFNKVQQDAFLHEVEEGKVTFIGATTENPSFELTPALLSRVRVYVLKPLDEEALEAILERALLDERGLGGRHALEKGLCRRIARAADGDARRALNMLEMAADLSEGIIGEEAVAAVTRGGVRRFDKGGDAFYDQISALHKAIRGSSPDGALYWLARMLDGGCDPRYIARRLTRMAAEDIGNADPRALALALDAWQAYERLGSPEGELALAQAAVYLACVPKSNAVYKAFGEAMADVERFGSLEVPLHLRNAPTGLMKGLGYGRGYRYDHDEPQGFARGQRYFPEGMPERSYYRPAPRGLELRIKEHLEKLREGG